MVSAFGRTGAGRPEKRETGQIEPPQKKWTRAGFADEAGAKFFEDGRDGSENLPEAVVGVLWGRRRNDARQRVNRTGRGLRRAFPKLLHGCRGVERVHELIVESGDGTRDEMERSSFAEAGLNFQGVVDEIKVYSENAIFVGDWGGGGGRER